MKFLKFLIIVLTIFGSSVFAYGYLNEKEIIKTIKEYYDRSPSTLVNNQYSKVVNIGDLKLTDNFEAKSKNDLINIYYTIVSSGMNEFTFFCSTEYIDCINDIKDINNDSDILSLINNFVNVFNSFKSIKTTYTSNGKITLHINRVYNKETINLINNKVDEIFDLVIDNDKSDYENILSIHDYIINNTKYDTINENNPNSNASNAYGVFFNNKATCNGYTDAAAIFFDRLNINNLRLSNDTHIWNLVYLDGKWLHLDLTWDDPVNNLNQDLLTHEYFLKTTEEFDKISETKEENKHDFNKELYDFIN